jgi:hypothetical protein
VAFTNPAVVSLLDAIGLRVRSSPESLPELGRTLVNNVTNISETKALIAFAEALADAAIPLPDHHSKMSFAESFAISTRPWTP